MKKILDVCCGGRMFWFDQKNPLTLFVDNRVIKPRVVGKGRQGRVRSVLPDKVMDFRKLDIPGDSYALVVFDPPHFKSLGPNSHMAQTYGRLDRKTWRDDLTKGFSECFRVLKEDGILIFKWNEHDIPLKEILALTPVQPLFGHPSGKAQKTHWVCFMKLKYKEGRPVRASEEREVEEGRHRPYHPVADQRKRSATKENSAMSSFTSAPAGGTSPGSGVRHTRESLPTSHKPGSLRDGSRILGRISRALP